MQYTILQYNWDMFCEAEIIGHVLLQHIHHAHELHVLGLVGLFRLQ
jgi:hypothetical protein